MRYGRRRNSGELSGPKTSNGLWPEFRLEREDDGEALTARLTTKAKRSRSTTVVQRGDDSPKERANACLYDIVFTPPLLAKYSSMKTNMIWRLKYIGRVSQTENKRR